MNAYADELKNFRERKEQEDDIILSLDYVYKYIVLVSRKTNTYLLLQIGMSSIRKKVFSLWERTL